MSGTHKRTWLSPLRARLWRCSWPELSGGAPCRSNDLRNSASHRWSYCQPAEAYFLARVRAAFFAAAERSALVRFRAADRAWRERAFFDAVRRLSFFSAFFAARARRLEVFFGPR